MAEPTKRHWFRFAYSLRTFFVLVTAAGLWLSWLANELRGIAERNAVARLVDELNGPNPCEDCGIHYYSTSLPWFRRLLGDRGYAAWIMVRKPVTPEQWNRIYRAFPEAKQFYRPSSRANALPSPRRLDERLMQLWPRSRDDTRSLSTIRARASRLGLHGACKRRDRIDSSACLRLGYLSCSRLGIADERHELPISRVEGLHAVEQTEANRIAGHDGAAVGELSDCLDRLFLTLGR